MASNALVKRPTWLSVSRYDSFCAFVSPSHQCGMNSFIFDDGFLQQILVGDRILAETFATGHYAPTDSSLKTGCHVYDGCRLQSHPGSENLAAE